MIAREEEYELIRLVQNNDDNEALNALIEAHKGWAYKRAGLWMNRLGKRKDLLIEDVAQVALIHMAQSVKKFDLNRNRRFLSFVTRSMDFRIILALRGGADLSGDLRSDIGPIKHKSLDETNDEGSKTFEAVDDPDNAAYDDSDTEFSPPDFDDDDESEWDLIERLSFLRTASLTERERFVIDHRCAGVGLAAIGNALGISKERVRQVELRAIQSLREQAGVQTNIKRDERKQHDRPQRRAAWKERMAERMKARAKN